MFHAAPLTFRALQRCSASRAACYWSAQHGCAMTGRRQTAARELHALGETDLLDRMYENMTVEEAGAFATELRAAVDRLRKRHAGKRGPRGAGYNGTYERKRFVWHNYSTFKEALASIEYAAGWYEKVSSLGFDVYASG